MRPSKQKLQIPTEVRKDTFRVNSLHTQYLARRTHQVPEGGGVTDLLARIPAAQRPIDVIFIRAPGFVGKKHLRSGKIWINQTGSYAQCKYLRLVRLLLGIPESQIPQTRSKAFQFSFCIGASLKGGRSDHPDQHC